MREIWVPDSRTNVTVQDGRVTVTESMVMTVKTIQAPKPGFANAIDSGRDNV